MNSLIPLSLWSFILIITSCTSLTPESTETFQQKETTHIEKKQIPIGDYSIDNEFYRINPKQDIVFAQTNKPWTGNLTITTDDYTLPCDSLEYWSTGHWGTHLLGSHCTISLNHHGIFFYRIKNDKDSLISSPEYLLSDTTFSEKFENTHSKLYTWENASFCIDAELIVSRDTYKFPESEYSNWPEHLTVKGCVAAPRDTLFSGITNDVPEFRFHGFSMSTLSIKEDNTFAISGIIYEEDIGTLDSISGTWEYNDNMILITYSKGPFIDSVSTDTLKIDEDGTLLFESRHTKHRVNNLLEIPDNKLTEKNFENDDFHYKTNIHHYYHTLHLVENQHSNESCSDNLDNDKDGYVDCEDFDCSNEEQCLSYFIEDTYNECADGFDNDHNGIIDCEEEKCKDFDFCKQ